jgi:hypothetical protein
VSRLDAARLTTVGINIEGVCGTTEGGQGAIHVLVEDAAATL